MPRKSRYQTENNINISYKYYAAGYIRLSSEDKDKANANDESFSIQNQKELINIYLKQYGDIKLENFYVDDGYTGTTFDRPGFQKLLEDIKNKKINTIIVKDLSRLGRNYIEVGNYLYNIFPLYNIRIISINENIDSINNLTQIQESIIGLKNIMNDEYARDISKKTRASLYAKKKNGEFCGGLAPYGYLKDPDNINHLIIDEFSASIVKKIYTMYLNGIGRFTIAKTLNEDGVLSPCEYRRKRINENREEKIVYQDKSYWRSATIKRILQNEAYCGDCIQGKYSHISYKDKTRYNIPKEKWIIVRNTHEPIIDRETFEKVQDLLKSKQIGLDNTPKKNSIYKNILKCADCKKRMLRKEGSFSNLSYKSWYCSTYISCSHTLCTKHKIKGEILDNAVLETIKLQISLVLDVEKTIKELLKEKSNEIKQSDVERKKEHLKKEINKMKMLKKKIYEDWKLEIISDDNFTDLKKEYEDNINTMSKLLNQLEQNKIKEEKIEKCDWVDNFRKYQNIQSLNEEVIKSLVEKIYVHEENRITIAFKFNDEYENALNYIKERSKKND